ncbi:fasciclin-like arabinogalactan protein 12 [Jatropha curcas]|uniref:fasciclin-like arabinogalactan protein 12 n=1 Tax=Jatropha curcas TaxID=180498 RepID=UPI0005FC3627|nr:fasciclin-like arabinogalactan protein 12 [Jatropha curcas]
MQQSLFSFSFLFLFLHFTKTLTQSPAAAPVQPPPAAPPLQAPPSQPPSGVQVPVTRGPLDVVKVLGKASHFTVFIRLLKATQVDTELFLQLNNTNNGATIFAPTDGAFSGIQVGTLNSLTDGDKIELVKFHIVPTFISTSQFQTVSNPVRTLAGTGKRFALNVTTAGNFVNITTGLTNTTISGTVYSDNRLAIYQVDRVLLPLDVFTPKPPAPAPAPALAPENPKKTAPFVESPNFNNPKDVSGSVSLLFLDNLLVFSTVLIVSAMLQF